MDEIKTGFGRINWIDITKKTGVILQEDDSGVIAKLPFRFQDIEVGTPATGQRVQFLIDATEYSVPVAKHIYVINDLAKRSFQSKM
ncbi:MAG: hypothetical protein HZC40_05955 [Chloroflexi bacterium]|nr:hypothetical protein [Chloroflexota bacterium]